MKIICIAILISAHAQAEEASPAPNKTQAPIETTAPNKPATIQSQTFVLKYASLPWNINSKVIDSAFMFIRDPKSGKIAKISVAESEPDSSFFSGKYSVQWDAKEVSTPEVFVPPQNLRNDARAVERFNQMLASGQIQPQPFAAQVENGKYTLEVYDTAEQAERAQKLYTDQLAAQKKAQKTALIKPKLSDSSLDVAKMAEQAKLLADLAMAAAQKEADRIHLEQIELQRREQKKLEQEKLNASEIQKRIEKAKELSERATDHYQKGEFKEAVELYQQATDLDPANQSYYFKYGVSLYRTEKFDQALVTLKLAQTEGSTEIEKKYYMGLIHFKLKELSAARTLFGEVKQSKDATLSSSAAFYEGLVLISEDDLVKAQAAFEFVLDHSNDPALDQKAEEYIEKIARMIEFKKIASKKWLLSASASAIYDSNILLIADNDAASGKGSLRETLAASADYRFFYKEDQDLSARVTFSDTQSADVDFTTADSLVLNLSTPYNKKGMMRGSAYRWMIAPAFEYMQLHDGNGDPYSALTSTMIMTDLMLIQRDDWFSSYSIEVRGDDSMIPESAEDDADAIKTSFKKTEMFFLDSAKKRAWIGSLGYTMNNAAGNERKYDRIDLLALYTAPILTFRNTSWNGGITAYYQTYGSSSDHRKDTNLGTILGITKVFTEDWSWATTATYNNNGSNVSANDYDRYSVTTTISYTWGR